MAAPVDQAYLLSLSGLPAAGRGSRPALHASHPSKPVLETSQDQAEEIQLSKLATLPLQGTMERWSEQWQCSVHGGLGMLSGVHQSQVLAS